jgi:hypothetical protein
VELWPEAVKSIQSLAIPVPFIWGDTECEDPGGDDRADAEEEARVKKVAGKLSALFAAKGSQTKAARQRAEENQGEEDDEFQDAAAEEPNTPPIDIVGAMRAYTTARKAASTGSPNRNDGRFITADEIRVYNNKFLQRGPDETTDTKIAQLELHERLHLKYDSGDLPKCMLSHYLKSTVEWRRELKAMLKSGDAAYLEKHWKKRMSKIPCGWTILADRGFAYDAAKYPNFNIHVTPSFVEGRDQFTRGELKRDITKCNLRWISETNFARVTDESSLEDVVSYEYFSIVQHVCDWAFGAANLCRPFYKPLNY